uniref:Uncharacterized protein n=1 Tax=Candidatus Methanomethylicus mesodigestus TaxID=1867258 RepID=A0A7C3J4V9_9CREN
MLIIFEPTKLLYSGIEFSYEKMKMSEELRQSLEDAIYKHIKKQIESGCFEARLRIEIDQPIEIKGMKGRIVGEIAFSQPQPLQTPAPVAQIEEGKKALQEEPPQKQEAEMSMQEVENLLKSLKTLGV